jgi:CRISPR/Cas system-associated exonuclease Cas4 (RecB family)
MKVNNHGQLIIKHGGKRHRSGRPKGVINKPKEITRAASIKKEQVQFYRGLAEYQAAQRNNKRRVGRPRHLENTTIDDRVIEVIKSKYGNYKAGKEIEYLFGEGRILFINERRSQYALLHHITRERYIISFFRSIKKSIEDIETDFHIERMSFDVTLKSVTHIINSIL